MRRCVLCLDFLALWLVLWLGLPAAVPAQLVTFDDPQAIGHDFQLTTHEGRRVTSRSFDGRLRLIYFGYTWCPDVCPLSVLTMRSVIKRLGPQSDEVVVLFITVDPARDDVERLADYARHFGFRLTALTGDVAEIRRTAEGFRVHRAIVPDGSFYLIDHTSLIYLMDRQGRFVSAFLHGTPPSMIAKEVRRHLD